MFAKELFDLYLPMYEVHRVVDGKGAIVQLSPHLLGWPMYPPRLYTILVHKRKAKLTKFSETLTSLFCRPMIAVHDLFVAPKDSTSR